MTPTDSSKWTGPLEEGGAIRRGTFTHRPGEPGFASDYARFAEAERIANLITPEVRSVMHLAAWLLLLSPSLLFVAWLVLRTVTRDAIAQDNVWWLIGWGSAVAAIAATQMAWRRPGQHSSGKPFLAPPSPRPPWHPSRTSISG